MVSDQAVVVVVVLFVVAIIVVRCFRQVLEVICCQVPGARWLESLNDDSFPKVNHFCLWMYWRNLSVTGLWLQNFWWAFTMGNLNGFGAWSQLTGTTIDSFGAWLSESQGPGKIRSTEAPAKVGTNRLSNKASYFLGSYLSRVLEAILETFWLLHVSIIEGQPLSRWCVWRSAFFLLKEGVCVKMFDAGMNTYVKRSVNNSNLT